MTRRRPQQRDPLEAAIEAALQPGRFIAYRAGWGFVSSLEEVAAQLEKLIRTGSERAVGLYDSSPPVATRSRERASRVPERPAIPCLPPFEPEANRP